MSINTTKQAYSQLDEDIVNSGEHTMTNREWLMSLSNEELAKYIDCPEDSSWDECLCCCDECKLQWLKAEYKEVSE